MLTKDVRREMFDQNPDMLFANGFDDAFIGHATYFNRALAVYDYRLCIKVLMERDGMTDQEAIEYMDYNVLSAFVGENTPLFLFRTEDD